MVTVTRTHKNPHYQKNIVHLKSAHRASRSLQFKKRKYHLKNHLKLSVVIFLTKYWKNCFKSVILTKIYRLRFLMFYLLRLKLFIIIYKFYVELKKGSKIIFTQNNIPIVVRNPFYYRVIFQSVSKRNILGPRKYLINHLKNFK